jgi:hypothetical protein
MVFLSKDKIQIITTESTFYVFAVEILFNGFYFNFAFLKINLPSDETRCFSANSCVQPVYHLFFMFK